MKGNQEPMLYTTNATVAALNHVPGFDPLKFLRRTISRKTGEDVMRLDLRYKKLWFRLACPTGRLKLNALRITEKMAIFEAKVYRDREDAEPLSSYIANCTLDAIMADDMPVPEQVTAEVVEKPKTVVLESVQPAQTPAEPPQNVIVLEQEPPAAAYTQSSPVEKIRQQMTYEQAQNVIVDCGTCKGWTLAQVADRRAASLRWYVKGYQGENNILRAAAAIIWDSLQEKQAG